MFDRKSHWQNIYREKQPCDVSWYQTIPELSLKFIDTSGIDKNDAIIDIGGGASTLVCHLLEKGYSSLSVLDISANALECARQQVGTDANHVEWIESDITEFTAPHPYSFWHDRAVFHFLTNKLDREKYVSALLNAVIPGGHVIIAAFAIGGPEKCSGLNIEQYDEPKIQQALGKQFRLVEQTKEIHMTPTGNKQEFIYFHFTRQ